MCEQHQTTKFLLDKVVNCFLQAAWSNDNSTVLNSTKAFLLVSQSFIPRTFAFCDYFGSFIVQLFSRVVCKFQLRTDLFIADTCHFLSGSWFAV